MRRFTTGLLAVCSLAAACSRTDVDPPAVVSDDDDSFIAAGKADGTGVEEGSAEACAILRVVRETDPALLQDDVGLAAGVVESIVKARSGAWIGTLAALDEVPLVGEKAFEKLRDWAGNHQESACGVIDVQVLAINDFHGNLEPPPGSGGTIMVPSGSGDPVATKAGGVEYLATLVRSLVANHPYSAVVSAGDLVGASPLLSALFHDEATIESMNLLGMAYSAVGNHELDEGLAELERLQQGGCHPVDGCMAGATFPGASFRFLSANVVDSQTGKPRFAAYELRAFRGARVAFIGVTTKAVPSLTIPANVAGLEFHDEVQSVNALVPEIRAQGVEAIVVLLHEGGFAAAPFNGCKKAGGAAFDLASAFDPAVDVVVTGHTNAAHVCDIDGKLITSAASSGRLLTDIVLKVDERTGELVSREADNVVVGRDVPKDPDQTALLERYREVAAPLANRVVGSITSDLTRSANAAGESALGDVISDSQLAATSAPDKGGAQLAFMNPYGIRADLLASQQSGSEKSGEVTFSEAFSVQPFSNGLVTMTLTGAQIDAMLEQQFTFSSQMILAVSAGFSYVWRESNPIGDRVSDLRIGGVPMDPAKGYRVTMNSFLADGGDGFTVARDGTDRVAGPIDLTAFEAWLASSSPLSPPEKNRIIRQ